MQYKLIGLVPLLAVMASAAFAAGPEDNVQTTRQGKAVAHCDSTGAQGLVFNSACGAVQKPVQVAAEANPRKARMIAQKTKKITRMPWQTGIFQ